MPDEEATTSSGRNRKNLSYLEIVTETINEGYSPVEQPSSALSNHQISAEDVLFPPDIIMTSSEPVVQPFPSLVNAAAQTEIVQEEPTSASLKVKLQGLITGLGTVSLTREEVSAFEDLFMDAKEKLYGAGRRWRKVSDSKNALR